jgi:hypothetical protein
MSGTRPSGIVLRDILDGDFLLEDFTIDLDGGVKEKTKTGLHISQGRRIHFNKENRMSGFMLALLLLLERVQVQYCSEEGCKSL